MERRLKHFPPAHCITNKNLVYISGLWLDKINSGDENCAPTQPFVLT